MKRTITIRVVTAVVVVVFVAGIWLDTGQLDLAWLRFFSAAVLVATVVLGLWDIWLWRLPLVQGLPGVTCCVRGTWRGTLTSFWVNPETGQSPPPKIVYLVIRQTAALISVRLLTNESSSTSFLASVNLVDGASVLTYLYLNRPDMRVEHRSRMHHGSTVLDISSRPTRRLKGRYWTDRDSKGELEFIERNQKLADDFAEATALFKDLDS